jgi:2-hydroxy-6-oxonona-2,4-dienedioate hydrolase
MRTIWSEVEGSRMCAVAVGSGSPVVLVHGYGVSGAYMLPLARALAPSCEAFVPDLPGQGKSEPSRRGGSGSIAGLADALGGWVAFHGLTRPVFVANSMGCQIVTDLAVRRPEHVGPMVLVGPTVDPARRTARHQLFGMLRETAREPLSLTAMAARDDAVAGIRTLLWTARGVLADRIEERLPLIEQPTLVVHGEKDGFVSRNWVERVTALLPRGRLIVVPGEPHAVNYTRPDLIAEIVLALLVEEGEHAGGELVWRLQHGDVSARKLRESRVGQHPVPLVGDSDRHESVAFAPNE